MEHYISDQAVAVERGQPTARGAAPLAIWRKHPLVLGAAVAVMLVSAVGFAAMTGLLPTARSAKPAKPATIDAPAARGATRPGGAVAGACATCGTVESVRAVEVKGDATGVGAVAGGVVGGVIGNQFGKGTGRKAMTVAGAAGGALAGHEVEKHARKKTVYRITIRMDDGSFRTISQPNAPGIGAGEKVRIVEGAVVAGG